MRSTFAGLSIASSGLFAAQRALDITGHNISNTNTRGYTRQRLNQSAQDPMNIQGGQGQLGLGVKMQFISQVRDEMLDIKYRQEVNTLGEWEEKYNSLTQVESIFNEPSETGIRKVVDGFFEGINSLTKDPSNPTNRSVFLQKAIGLAQNFNDMYSRFEKMVVDSNEEVEASVRAINSMATQIAKLNRQILESELDGSRANDLRDARNLLVDDLSKLVDLEVKNVPINNGKSSTLTILIQGTPLVNHVDTNVLELETGMDHPMFTDGQDIQPVSSRKDLENIKVSNIKWASGSTLVQEKLGGAIGGQLQQRDGYKDETKGAPYYVRFLSEFANTFAQALNDIHDDGYSLNGAAASGLPLFTTKNGSTNFISASELKVNQALLDDPTKLSLGLGDGAPDNNKNAIAMLNLRSKKDFEIRLTYDTSGAQIVLGEGTPEDVLKTMIASLGVDAQEAKRMFNNQQYLTEEVDSFRLSVSGVSQDEEMSNMIKFQHAYNAAARMITTVDEMIDVIINRMGRVGL
ncbi:flagellar hook-associated protein 1 [Acetoanaerobium sticklandii]|uniref:Flagellar hook-associated protein 1 n=2 Tax=Acetoanaerobium TaxID=186831 RepID=E3PUM8_ACESD|nr:flagellar hook-associated protein FlgK [Acetoanaerobium sticklandii]CBH22466.1 flagellar hook-associated protein 1 [Acetoanaerobium sticklandii]